MLSLSIWYLAGLKPFLSSMHTAHFPSDMTMPAGPSHGSICMELYSWKLLISASNKYAFCHAGGITILIALNNLTPPLIKISIILSNADESDPVSFTNCLNFWIFGIRGLLNFDDLAFTQFLFPLIALISPLWAKSLKGWARCHLGCVLVENLWWNTHIEDLNCGDFKSK